MSADDPTERPELDADADTVRVQDLARQRPDAPPRELEVTEVGDRLEVIGATQAERLEIPERLLLSLERVR